MDAATHATRAGSTASPVPPRRAGWEAGEGGFALVAALLLLLALTALGTAGFFVSRTDYRINQNHHASVRAFYIANAGLWDYLAAGKATADTQTYVYPDGRARVWTTELMEVDAWSRLLRITSRGRHLPPQGGVAERRVSTVAIHAAAGFDVNAAVLAAGGLRKNGAAGTVSGIDHATPADCPLGGVASLAGLAIPPGGLSMSGGGKGKGKGGTGSPPGFYGEPPIDDSRPALALLQGTGIEWQGILDGSWAQPDFVVSEDGWPSFSTDVGPEEYPLVLVDRDPYALNPIKSGRGTLAATGDLTLNGSFEWDGIILVGGNLTSNGKQSIRGTVVTGLNLLLGGKVAEDDLGNGNWDYRYDSCNVLAALKALGAPVEEPGSWFEEM